LQPKETEFEFPLENLWPIASPLPHGFVCEFGGEGRGGEGKALRGGKYEGKWRNLSNFLKE